MQPAGARTLREDDNEMSREAVLLQWERKIEAAERTGSGRFVRSPQENAPDAKPLPLRAAPAEAPAAEAPATASEPARHPQPERRTVTITGQPTRPRRRPQVIEAQLAQPDRIALWAFLLGLVLVAVAAGTAHA
jgi:hypothetical protein